MMNDAAGGLVIELQVVAMGNRREPVTCGIPLPPGTLLDSGIAISPRKRMRGRMQTSCASSASAAGSTPCLLRSPLMLT